MKKEFLIVSGLVLVALGLWWMLLTLLKPPVSSRPTDTIIQEPSSEQTPTSPTENKAIDAAAEEIPELNPVDKTNPFSGTYKNPFAK